MDTINVLWEGPITIPALAKLDQPTDKGLYQIYGPNPTYRRVDLLYIGLTRTTFAERVNSDDKWSVKHTGDDSQLSYYVGRLIGTDTPDSAEWNRQIALAESLLICAHYPAHNNQKNGALDNPATENLRVLNWGQYRDLFMEVSGERMRTMSAMKPYGIAPTRLTTPTSQVPVAGI